MAVETITLVLDILLFSILGIIVLKSLWGLKQGLWKTSVSLVVSIIFYILVISLNSTFTGAYYNLDISFFYNGSFVINEHTIQLSTVGETLHDVIIALASTNGDVSLSSEALQVLDALAMSILAFVVFILHIIIVAFIIVPVISTLIYHLILKPILGKNITKKHKIRVAGFFVGGLKTTLTCALLLTPFSALVNRVVEVVGNREFNGEVAAISRYTDAYSSSAFAKLFTSVRINGRSFDIFITDFVTTIDYGNNKASSFLNEVEMIANIACDGIEQGVYDLQTGQIDFTKMLSEVFVTNVLTRFAESPLIVSLLPVVLSIVSNQENIKAYVDLTEVDWQAIEWDDQLNVLSSVYETFYDTGLVDKMFDQEALNSYELSRDVYPYFKETFASLDNSTILTSIMPYLMVSFAKSLEQTDFAGIFPIEVEAYKNISIGQELSAIFDAVMILSDLSSYAFDDTTVINTTPLEIRMMDTANRKFLTIGDLMNQDKMTSLINFLLTSEAINGNEGENNYISSDNSTPINTISIFNGVSQGNEIVYRGLLDSQLVSKNLGSVIKFVTSTNEEIKKYNIQAIIDDVCSDPEYDWKNEIDNLLNILGIVYNNDKLVIDENFDFFDAEVAKELIRITEFMDDSDLVKRLAKPIITTLMGDVDIMGLSASDLYFGEEDDEEFEIGRELKLLLELLPEIGEIKDSFALEEGQNVLDLFFDENNDLSEKMRSVLKGIYNSNILNHDKNPEGLNNFERLLKNFLNDFEGIKFKDMNDQFLKTIRTSIGSWAGEGGEIDRICDAFASLKKMPSIKAAIEKAGSEETVTIGDIESSEIKDLICIFSDSDIIGNSMGDICNQYFAQMMSDMGVEVDFNEVESWEDEANNLVIAIDTIKSISNKTGGEASFNLTSLDFASLRYNDGTNGAEDLGILLKSIYRLDCIKNDISTEKKQDDFGKMVYNISRNLLSTLVNENDLKKIEEDFNLEKDEVKAQNIVWCYEDGDDRRGVIDDFVTLMDFVLSEDSFFDGNNLDLSTIFNSNTLDTEILRSLLGHVNQVYVFRSIIEPILKTNTQMEIGSLKMDKLNVEIFSNEYDYLSTYNKEENVNTISTRNEEIAVRLDEINDLMDILDQVNTINEYLNEGKEGIEIFKNNEGEDRIKTIKDLLNKCYESKLFNTTNPNYDGSDKDTSLFEDVVLYIMKTSTLDEMVYNDNFSNKESFTRNLVKDITNSSKGIDVIENVNWKNEIELLCSAFDYIVNECSASLDQIDGITGFGATEINEILTRLNESYLCHTAVANLINSLYEQTGINNYSLQGDKVDARSIDENDELTFKDKVNLWREDIESITAIYEFSGGNSFSDFLERDKLKEGNTFESILPHFVTMHHVQKWKYDIMYFMFDSCGVTSLLSGESDQEKANTIKVLTSSITTKESWAFEGARLDKLVHIEEFYGEANSLSGFTGDTIYNLIESTFTYDSSLSIENRYKRGFLATEIVTSLLNRMIDTLNQDEEVPIDYDWKVNNFKNINYYEMNGLKGTMDMVQNLLDLCKIIDNLNISEYQNNWKESFLNSMTLMGEHIEDAEKDYYYYLEQDKDNSIIAKKLYIYLIEDQSRISNHVIVGNLSWDLEDGLTFKEKAEQLIKSIDIMLGLGLIQN